jgi:hypothetical protein
MRRIKVILAALAAMMMMAALSAPAMAQPVPTCYGFCGNSDTDDSNYYNPNYYNPNYYNPNYYNSDPDDSNYYGDNCRWVQDYDGDWFQTC